MLMKIPRRLRMLELRPRMRRVMMSRTRMRMSYLSLPDPSFPLSTSMIVMLRWERHLSLSKPSLVPKMIS
jgi:hypothetical protein